MTKSLTKLGRRERQLMDVLVRRKRATAAEVRGDLPDPPSYSAVRGMLRLLEDKGYVKHEWDGPRHVYLSAVAPERLRRDALRHLVETFFDNSTELAVVSLLGDGERQLTGEQYDRLAKLIANAKKGGGRS